MAAIASLAEGRPGIVEFWKDVRDSVFGWPSLMLDAVEALPKTREGREPLRRAELALYVAFHYCEHRSERRVGLISPGQTCCLCKPLGVSRGSTLLVVFYIRMVYDGTVPGEDVMPSTRSGFAGSSEHPNDLSVAGGGKPKPAIFCLKVEAIQFQ